LHSLTQVIRNKTKDNSDKILLEEVVKLKQKKSELETQLQLENRRFQILSRTKHTGSMQFTTEFERNITRIDKDLGQIDSEIKLKEENILILKKRYLEDLEEKIRNNLVQIERSKTLIKEYVNIFVESISILYSDRKYSVIKTKMRDAFIRKPLPEFSALNVPIPDDIWEPFIYLIINKHDNHRIRLCHTSKNIKILQGGRILLADLIFGFDELFANLEYINLKLNKKYFKSDQLREDLYPIKEVPFIRLKVY
jgi:hypothetical protein